MNKIEELIQQLCPGGGVEFKSLGEVAEYRRGSFPQPYGNANWYNGEGAMPFVQVADVAENMLLVKKTKQRISKLAQPLSVFVPKDTVIVTLQGSIGRVALTQYDCYVDRTLAIFVKYNIDINKKFFAYQLERKFGIEKEFARGSTLKTITKEEFSKFEIPIPPLPIQQEIVSILDKFTQLEAELEAELQARSRQYNYYRNQLLNFEGKEVEWKTLNNISINLDSKRKPVRGSDRVAGKYPYYGASGIVDYVSEYIFDGDYLLVSEDGANLLTRNTPIAFSITGKTWVNNHAHILKFDNYPTRRFVEIYLNSIDLSKFISGAAQPKLNQENLNKIPIPIPPFSEQERIVAILDKFDALVNDLSVGLPAEIAARRKQYEYYRGKLLSFKSVVNG